MPAHPFTRRKTDRQLRDELLEEMEWDTRLEPAEIGVEVNNGVVSLTGIVDSWAKRVAAKDAAHRVSGVLDVANDIVVHAAGTGERTDAEIAEQARIALEWDVFVPHEKIHTTVSNGIVTLEGVVNTGVQRADAERAVRNLAGVVFVTNDIHIRAAIQNADLRRVIHAALERRASREAERVRVDVHEGSVKLVGVVDSLAKRDAVLAAVWGTRGVHDVDDRLSVV